MTATSNLQIWRATLTGIPRVNAEQWKGLDWIGRWLIASRAAVLVMTVLAACISGLFAWRDGQFDGLRFAALCGGLVLAHATNNILNDLSDHKRGVDKDNAFRTRYGTQPVEEGFLTPGQAWGLAAITGLPALAMGTWLCVTVGTAVLPFFAAGIFLVFGYNWPLKHYGLGEPTVVAVWGPLMVGGGYLTLTGVWSTDVALASLPYALGPTMVLFGKHTDKIPWDKPRGVRTLPVLLGAWRARMAVLGLLVVQYGLVVALVVADVLGWPALLVLGAAPFLRHMVPVYLDETPDQPPEEFPDEVWPLWYSAFAFVHCRRFGALYLVGLLLGV